MYRISLYIIIKKQSKTVLKGLSWIFLICNKSHLVYVPYGGLMAKHFVFKEPRKSRTDEGELPHWKNTSQTPTPVVLFGKG